MTKFDPVKNESFVFYTTGLEAKSEDVNGTKHYFIEGHIDSGDLDLVNDIVTDNCMNDISSQFKARTIKLDLDHETLREEKSDIQNINLTRIPLGKAISEDKDQKGNKVKFELNPNWKKFDSKGDVTMSFDEVWSSTKSGYYDSFSIAYVPIRTAMKTVGESQARLLDKVNMINVALTGNPINPGASMTSVMAKSLDWLKEREDMENKGLPKRGTGRANGNADPKETGTPRTDEDRKKRHAKPDDELDNDEEFSRKEKKSLEERVTKLESKVNADEPVLSGKSKKEADKMTDEKTTDVPKDTPVVKAHDEKPAESEQKPPEKPVGTEEKSLIDAKAFGELKSLVEGNAKEIKSLNETLGKLKVASGFGPEQKSDKQPEVKAQGSALNLI